MPYHETDEYNQTSEKKNQKSMAEKMNHIFLCHNNGPTKTGCQNIDGISNIPFKILFKKLFKLIFTINPSRTGPLCKQHCNLVITAPADALTPGSARPSAVTVLILCTVRHIFNDFMDDQKFHIQLDLISKKAMATPPPPDKML